MIVQIPPLPLPDTRRPEVALKQHRMRQDSEVLYDFKWTKMKLEFVHTSARVRARVCVCVCVCVF